MDVLDLALEEAALEPESFLQAPPRNPHDPRDLILLCLLSGTASPQALARLARWRSALLAAGVNFAVIRQPSLQAQDAAIQRASTTDPTAAQTAAATCRAAASSWQHVCGRCGDGDCERRLFQALRAQGMSCDADALRPPSAGAPQEAGPDRTSALA